MTSKALETVAKETGLVAQKFKGAIPGFDIGQEDIQLPHLFLTQSNAKMVKAGQVQPGKIFNATTLKPYDTIEIVPVFMQKYWDLLKPAGQRMGFEARVLSATDPRLSGRRFKQEVRPDGSILPRNVDMGYLFVALVDGNPVKLKMKGSNIVAAKTINTIVAQNKTYGHNHKFKLSVGSVTKEGETYYSYVVEYLGSSTPEEREVAQGILTSLAPRAAEVALGGGPAESEEVPF